MGRSLEPLPIDTLVDLLNEAACRWGQLPAVRIDEAPGWGWTYIELLDAALAIADHLRSRGVGKGDRVLVWGANGPEWVAAFFAVQIAAAVAVPLDVRSQESFLHEIVRRTEPKYALVGPDELERIESSGVPATGFAELRGMRSDGQTIGSRTEPDDIAELVFTSGTTGAPKGVMLTHRNLVANLQMCRLAFAPGPQTSVVSILPLSHMFEQMGGLLVPLSGGASVTYAHALRPDAIFSAMTAARVTNMTCVPQVLKLFREGIEREVRRQRRGVPFAAMHAVARLLPLQGRRRLFRPLLARFGGRLDYIACGGAYLDPNLARWWERLGVKIPQGYGMTEASPVVAANTPNSRDLESVGRPLPGVTVTISGDREILVRGDNLSPGYWRDPEATAAAFADGWYHSGDLGFLDRAGRLHLIGRSKNVIVLANGLNVYPEDVERALLRDERVKDTVVLGVQHGQDVEVHAVLLTEHGDDAAAIVRRANATLAPHQQVRRHTVWPEATFPLTATLKPRRSEIAERLEEPRRQDARHG